MECFESEVFMRLVRSLIIIIFVLLVTSCDKPLHYSIPENILLPVENNGSWGYINQYGKLIVDYRFDKATQFDKEFGIVTYKGKQFIIDNTGRLVFNRGFDTIRFNGTDYSADYQYVLRPKEKKIYNIGYDAYLYWKDDVYVVTIKESDTKNKKNCLVDINTNTILPIEYGYFDLLYEDFCKDMKFPFLLDHINHDIALFDCKNSYGFYKLQIKILLQQQVLLVFARTVLDLKIMTS